MKNRLLSALIAALMLLAAIPTVRAAFSDTEDHWAESYIEKAVSLGLFSGVSDTEFAPNETMTRGMFVTVLGRLEGIDPEAWQGDTAPQFFDDVPADAYFAPYVSWGVCNGIVNGMSETAFEPDTPVTRQQMAKLVAFYAARMNYGLRPAQDEVPESFADQSDIAPWAVDSVEALRESAILNGAPDQNGALCFFPEKTATRAECAAVFCRLAEALLKPFLPAEQPKGIAFTETACELSVGESRRLTVTFTPEGDFPLVWRSSAPAVVSVDENGVLQAHTVGTATVSAYTANGLSASCIVTCPDEELANGEESYAEKCIRVFGEVVDDPRLYYTDRASAEADMEKVTVQVWDIGTNGQKYTREFVLVVHKNLAPTIRALFRELYQGEERFPIKQLGGFSWSGKSEHSIGCAIDINPVENYYCDPDGNPIVGSYWKQGEDPYSIPLDGELVRIMKKYGFTQGIYWRSGYKDYMHFSFFGT